MNARKVGPNLVRDSEVLREDARLSEEELSYAELSSEWCAELLDPLGWHEVLETFAGTMRMAVALTDSEGRLLGECHNPQPAWRLAQTAGRKTDGGCPFCLAPPASCTAVEDAIRTGKLVMVEDYAGLAHAAVPLALGGQPMGALIAGQVFCRYPEPLPLQRVARDWGVSRQQLWQEAIQQVPLARASLQLYGTLLMSLGRAFLGQRYAALLQKKLAQNSERYRLFFDGIKDYALLTVDSAGRVTSWNSGAERLFGYRAAEIIGRDAACLAIPEGGQAELQQQMVLEADRSGSVEREGWRLRKDGTRFLGAGVLASIGQGDAAEFGEQIRDVTELRRSEQDLQQSQRLEGIGVLAGGIAHDFNNLLAGITGSLSFAKTSLSPENPAYPMVEIAEQSSARAAELVAQLLAYSGKGNFVVTRFDLSALISDLLPLIAASIPRIVELKLSLAPGLPWIEADASKIRQIVMNLIINAAEAIGAEGGTVRVSTGVSDSGADIFLEVKDSGSGMSESTKAKMFEPFFTTKFAGRGLGLAAVSGIVRSHGGKMTVDSTPGQGTTFTVSFPAVQADVLRLVDPPALSALPATGTILVVDDEPGLRKVATAILKRAGYSVLTAKDGREGVELFRKNSAEIVAVLLDMTMPVMGGHEALQLIREIQPGAAVVVSSGYDEACTREELGGEAAAGFIQKPYTAIGLLEGIRKAAQHSVRS